MAGKRAGKSTIGAYNAAVKAIKAQTGVTHREAQQAYRSAKIRLGHPPTAKEAKSAVVREEAKRAGARLRAKAREFDKRIERAIAKAREPARKARDREGAVLPPPGGRGGRRGAETGRIEGPGGAAGRPAGGAADRGRGRRQLPVIYDEGEVAEFPVIDYEEEDSPEG